MRQLLDFIPWVIFFVCVKTYDFFVATQALIITTAVILLFLWFHHRRRVDYSFKGFISQEKLAIVSCLLVTLFGSFTLYFHNTHFLIWKVTILYLLFATLLLGSELIFHKPILKTLLSKEISLPDRIWRQLTFIWALLFFLFSIINLYIGYYHSQMVWVNFKTFIFPAIMFICVLLTGIYIYRCIAKNQDKA